MSNRFHNKIHRHNHHTNSTKDEVDSSHDPIASITDPFLGNFYLSGMLSAISVTAPDISATTMNTTYLYANSAVIHTTDMHIAELSGFEVNGIDSRLEPPNSVKPSLDTLLSLSGVGLWSENWGRFNGSVKINNNLTANKASFNYISSIDLAVGNSIVTDNISSTSLNLTAINIWNNLDLHGYSISGIGNDSLYFESSAKINSDILGNITLKPASNTGGILVSSNSIGINYDSPERSLDVNGEINIRYSASPSNPNFYNVYTDGDILTFRHAYYPNVFELYSNGNAKVYGSVLTDGISSTGGNSTIDVKGSLNVSENISAINILTNTITSNDGMFDYISSINLVAENSISVNNISSTSLNLTAINIWNNLDLHGYSISGIGNNSLAFQNGTKIGGTDNSFDINTQQFYVSALSGSIFGNNILVGGNISATNMTISKSVSSISFTGNLTGDLAGTTPVTAAYMEILVDNVPFYLTLHKPG